MKKFQVGDKVRLDPSIEWTSEQLTWRATVKGDTGNPEWIIVQWDHSKSNGNGTSAWGNSLVLISGLDQMLELI